MSSGKGKREGGGAKRNSVMLQPMAGGSLIPGFVDSEDEEDQAPAPPPPRPAPPAAIPGGPIPGVQSGSGAGAAPKAGDPDHRPLVGGFAAAAYEAARAHHYKAKAAQQKRKSKHSS